jgi:Outer membrane protein beta-barrel domain
MKTVVLLTVILFSSYGLVCAQAEKKPEFFAGYSYENVNPGVNSSDFTSTVTTLDNRFNTNGVNLSAADYFTRRLGVAADFSANFNSRSDTFGGAATQSKFSLYNITGGPQLRFPNSGKLTPFVHVLAGVARRNLTETFTGGTTSFTDHNTSFAMNFGGGVDYRLNGRFAWRIAQFDYNPIFLRSRIFNSVTLPNQTLNGFRFSTGIVIK